jgi:hypothetical protein
MHFSARSALLASCLAISVQALPVTYSVVDVDGGSAANGATGSADQPATIYQTVTKSQDVEEPEPTTVSVSVTIVETQHASATSTSASSSSSSLSSSTSSQQASAQASSPASSPIATPTGTQDALSVLQSTFLTSHTSVVSTPSAKSTITQAPSASSASQASPSSTEECDASSVTVTAEVTDAEEFSTVVLLSTTTITPSAAPTSYYDDGMWHTRYAIKPAASPAPVIPATKDDDAAPKSNKPSKPLDDKPANGKPNPATNATSQAGNATYHSRREIDTVASTSTVPAVAADNVPEVSDAPLMLVQPLRAQAPGTAAPSDVSTADAAASEDVLSTNDDIATGKTAKREATYNVVSWNETTEG